MIEHFGASTWFKVESQGLVSPKALVLNFWLCSQLLGFDSGESNRKNLPN